MKWEDVNKQMPAGHYIVETFVPHYTINRVLMHKAILEVDMHYDEEGKQRWSCKNQKPLKYLKDGI